MKILLFSGTLQVCPPEGYGAEVATWDLAEALGQLGHEVFLAAPAGSLTPKRGRLVEVPRTTSDQRSPNWLEVEWRAAFELVKSAAHAVDVVHDLSCSVALHRVACAGGEINPAWTGSPLKCTVPHLYTQNGIAWYEPRSSRHNVVVVSNAAQALSVDGCDEWADTMLEGARQPALATSRVVRYGCDTNFYRPSMEGHEKDLIAYVGRPHPHKGILYLLEVARLRPDLQFTCAWRATTAEHRKYADAFYRQLKVSGLRNVDILTLPEDPSDHHKMKRDLMATAAVLLHPAVYVDSCPRTVAEAQACGTPVVAFQRGGVPEITFPGRTSVLVPPTRIAPDIDIDAARELAAALDIARQLDRIKIRAWAVATLSRERMAQDYLQLYKAVVAGGRW